MPLQLLPFRPFTDFDYFAFAGAGSGPDGEKPSIAEVPPEACKGIAELTPCFVVGFEKGIGDYPEQGWIGELFGQTKDGGLAAYIPGVYCSRQDAELACAAALLNRTFIKEFLASPC